MVRDYKERILRMGARGTHPLSPDNLRVYDITSRLKKNCCIALHSQQFILCYLPCHQPTSSLFTFKNCLHQSSAKSTLRKCPVSAPEYGDGIVHRKNANPSQVQYSFSTSLFVSCCCGCLRC